MFKLQKNINSKSILTKNMYIIRDGYDKHNGKLFYSMIASNIGINLIEYKTGVTDHKIVNLIQMGVGALATYESILYIIDTVKKIKTANKISDLNDILKEKEIDVNLFDESMLTVCSDKINNTFKAEIDFLNGKKLLSDNDETFYYVDKDRKIDITNEVNNALTKKKSKQSK